MDFTTGIVLVLALIVFVFAVVLIVVVVQRRRRPVALPDGDYIVIAESTEDTPQGVVTTFRVEEPAAVKGRRIKVLSASGSNSKR